jgi:hypothetical protein
MIAVSNDGRTLTMTWTLHLSEPMTDEERDAVIGNIYEHIFNEQAANIPSFVKVAEVVSPDGKYRRSVRDMMDSVEGAFRTDGVPTRDAPKEGGQP